MQPTYLPWSGYFHLISKVDTFVFLDDVQFDRRSWQSRNRILLGKQPHTLSVPVRKSDRSTPICQIEVNNDVNWREAHFESIRHAYAKAAFGSDVLTIFEETVAGCKTTGLGAVNALFTTSVSKAMGLQAKFVQASELQCGGRRAEHLLEICKTLGADSYLSPVGSREYIVQDGDFDRSGFPVSYSGFQPHPYTQRGVDQFVSHLSIVDVIAHLGWDGARDYVHSEGEQI
ncbi:MAG: WbqC family protein [Pseudomonadota bacterium]